MDQVLYHPASCMSYTANSLLYREADVKHACLTQQDFVLLWIITKSHSQQKTTKEQILRTTRMAIQKGESQDKDSCSAKVVI